MLLIITKVHLYITCFTVHLSWTLQGLKKYIVEFVSFYNSQRVYLSLSLTAVQLVKRFSRLCK